MSAPPDANGNPIYLYTEVVLESDLDRRPAGADHAGLRRGSVWATDGERVRVEWPGGERHDHRSDELLRYEPPTLR